MIKILRRRVYGYKCINDHIVELIIDTKDKNNLSKKVYNSKYAKYKVERAYVNRIYNKFPPKLEINKLSINNFQYIKGEHIKDNIYFHLSEAPAFYDNLVIPNHYTDKYKRWNKNGRLNFECNYIKGSRDGLYIFYHNNGKLAYKCYYKNNKQNGIVEFWYPNSKTECKYEVINDKKEGLYESWHDNGVLSSKCFYKKDFINGIREEWFQNGQLNIRSNYDNGILNGLYEVWNKNGKLQAQLFYKNGIKIYYPYNL